MKNLLILIFILTSTLVYAISDGDVFTFNDGRGVSLVYCEDIRLLRTQIR